METTGSLASLSGINRKPDRSLRPVRFGSAAIVLVGLIAVHCFFGLSSACSQSRTLTVLSVRDSLPVSDAYVIFQEIIERGEKKQKAAVFTGADGKAEAPFADEAVVKIFLLGFKDATDTLLANESKTIYIHPFNIPIEEVVVTAQYTPGDLAHSVYPVEVIKKDAIEKRGAANLSQALAQESNIRISQDNILGSVMTMQGLGGQQIKIMMDGIPVIGRENGNIDISQLNLNNAKRIEIIEGPVSVQYGTNALGGVVNIITDHSRNDGWSARLNGYYESVGVYNADAGFGFGKKKHSFDLSGGRNFFDGYSEVDTMRFKEWKPKEQYFGMLQYGYSLRRLNLSLTGNAFYEKITDRGKPRPPYDISAFDDYYYSQRYSGAASLDGEILENHYLDQVFAYSYYSRIRNSYYKDLVTLENTMTANPGDQDTTRFSSYLVRGFVSRNKPEKIFNYQIGYDINIDYGEGGKMEAGSQMIGDYAIFSSFNFKPVEELALQAGIRWSYNTDYMAPVTPSFNLKWSPTKELTIRTSYARGFRAPSLKELYLDFVDLNHDIHGNPNLEAENSHNVSFSLGYDHKMNKHKLGIAPSFYFNDVNNLIALAELGIWEYTYVNVENMMTMGSFLGLKYSYDDFNFLVNAGYSSQKQDESGSFYYSPEVSAQAGYLIPKALITVSVFNKFNGKQTFFIFDEDSGIAGKELDSYNILDVSLNRQFWGKRISLTAGVKNILDVNNVGSTGGGGIHSGPGDFTSIAWGRSFFASLKFTFEKK